MGGRGRLRRARIKASLILSVLLVALAVLGGVYVVWNPYEDRPDQVDAVIVLGSGADRRTKGREVVVEDDVSGTLVFSLSQRILGELKRGDLEVVEPWAADPSSAAHWPDGTIEQCDAEYNGYSVLCLYPAPNSTAGEALGTAQLAAEEGWESILVVTETSHLLRARNTFNRCTPEDLTIYGVASEGPPSLREKAYRTVYELVANARDLFVSPC